MKKILLLSCILLSHFTDGQSSLYKPFPVNYGNWIYRYYDDFHNATAQETQYTLDGDTLIVGVMYKKIFVNSFYNGGLREDAKRIYFVPNASATEYLLYDFNLLTGDTIVHPFGGSVCANDTFTVASIDSILLSDGYHKRFMFNAAAPSWIEGVGSIEYLLAPLQTFCASGNDLLECMNNDNLFHYPSNQSSCTVSVTELSKELPGIIVYPNPSCGSFTIQWESENARELIVTNLLGSVIYQRKASNETQIKIDNLQSGIYFVVTKDNFGLEHRIKIINNP